MRLRLAAPTTTAWPAFGTPSLLHKQQSQSEAAAGFRDSAMPGQHAECCGSSRNSRGSNDNDMQALQRQGNSHTLMLAASQRATHLVAFRHPHVGWPQQVHSAAAYVDVGRPRVRQRKQRNHLQTAWTVTFLNVGVVAVRDARNVRQMSN